MISKSLFNLGGLRRYSFSTTLYHDFLGSRQFSFHHVYLIVELYFRGSHLWLMNSCQASLLRISPNWPLLVKLRKSRSLWANYLRIWCHQKQNYFPTLIRIQSEKRNFLTDDEPTGLLSNLRSSGTFSIQPSMGFLLGQISKTEGLKA